MPSDKYRQASLAKLIDDVTKGHVAQILYKNDEHCRTIHPHAVFEAGTGNILISAFQFENPNEETSEPGWRDFAIKDIRDVIFWDDRLEPASDFKPNAERYGFTISKINFANKERN